MFNQQLLEQAAIQVAARHDPQGVGALHIDRIPLYLEELAQAGCPHLLCNQLIMVQVVEDQLDCKVNFGVSGLIDVYRFIERHQSSQSNPPAQTTYEERVNPDGSITKISTTHSVETHVGLPVSHHHIQPPTSTVFVQNVVPQLPHQTVYTQPVHTLYNQPVVYQEPVTVVYQEPVVVHPTATVTHITGAPHFVAPGTIITNTTTTSEVHPGI